MEMDPLAEVQTKSEVVEPMADLIVPMKIEADHDAFENFMSSFQENSTKAKDKRKDFDSYCNIDIGTENLIQVMERHPGLWDPRHLDYPNKQKRDTEWLKVADELLPNWNFLNETQDVLREIKKRWRNTRDSYKKDKVNRDSADDPAKRKRRRYIFSKQLSFLDPVLQFKEFNRSSNAMMSNMSGFEDGPQFIVDRYDLDYSPKQEPIYPGVDDTPSTSSFVAQVNSSEFDPSLPLMSTSGQHSNSRPRNHKRNNNDRNLQEFNHFLSARKKSRSIKTNNNNSSSGSGGGNGGSGLGGMSSGGVVSSSHHNNNSASSQNSMNCSGSSSNNNGSVNIGQNNNNNQNAFAGAAIRTGNNNSGGNMWKSVREDDEDRYFLLSLLNDIKKVPEHRKLQLKTELLLSIQKYQNLDAESTNSGNVTYLNGFEFEQDMRECYTSSNSESSESMFAADNDEQ